MIGYVTLGTNDLARAARFYDALAAEMGVGRLFETERSIAWGDPGGAPGVAVMAPFDGRPATVGNGVMVALEARDPAQVDRLHALALAHGGICEGPAGPRGETYYAGYFRDPDGNKLNAFFMAVPG